VAGIAKNSNPKNSVVSTMTGLAKNSNPGFHNENHDWNS
jgi:hypothetical protein